MACGETRAVNDCHDCRLKSRLAGKISKKLFKKPVESGAPGRAAF